MMQIKDGRSLTLKTDELSSGTLTGKTSMKLNAFHCGCQSSACVNNCRRFLLMSAPFGLAMEELTKLRGDDDADGSSPRCARATRVQHAACGIRNYKTTRPVSGENK